MLCPVLNWNLKILVSFVVQTSKMSRPFVLIQVELLSERVFKTCSSSVRIGCTTWQTWQTQGPVVGVGFLPQVCSINSLQVFLYLPVRSKLTHTLPYTSFRQKRWKTFCTHTLSLSFLNTNVHVHSACRSDEQRKQVHGKINIRTKVERQREKKRERANSVSW